MNQPSLDSKWEDRTCLSDQKAFTSTIFLWIWTKSAHVVVKLLYFPMFFLERSLNFFGEIYRALAFLITGQAFNLKLYFLLQFYRSIKIKHQNYSSGEFSLNMWPRRGLHTRFTGHEPKFMSTPVLFKIEAWAGPVDSKLIQQRQ